MFKISVKIFRPILFISIFSNFYFLYQLTNIQEKNSDKTRRKRENIIELRDQGLEYNAQTEKTFEISILHIFEPFGNEELGKNVRQDRVAY